MAKLDKFEQAMLYTYLLQLRSAVSTGLDIRFQWVWDKEEIKALDKVIAACGDSID